MRKRKKIAAELIADADVILRKYMNSNLFRKTAIILEGREKSQSFTPASITKAAEKVLVGTLVEEKNEKKLNLPIS